MRVGDTLLCRDTQRRALLRCANDNSTGDKDTNKPRWTGLDYVEYEFRSGNRSELLVYFLCDVPDAISCKNFVLEDADGRQKYPLSEVSKLSSRCVRVLPKQKLCQPRAYRLRLCNSEGSVKLLIDPQFSTQLFTATADETEIDPRPIATCPPRPTTEPQINYLARDFNSLRQLLLDRLALLIPDWKERHVPDLGMTLVELLAYVGDYLSYYQDAVATEAYLNTSRQRISVRRHVRLVDYQLHEGCCARTFAQLEVSGNVSLNLADAFFITAHPDEKYRDRLVLPATALERTPPHSFQAFEPQLVCERDPRIDKSERRISLFQEHNRIQFYTWNHRECCLPAGTTRATLKDGSDPVPVSRSTERIPVDCHQDEQNPSAAASCPDLCYRPEEQVATEELPCGKNSDRDLRCWKLQHLAPGSILLLEEVRGPETHLIADADPQRRWVVRLTKVEHGLDPVTGERLVEVEWAAEDALPFSLCISSVGPPELECQHKEDISVARGNMLLIEHGLAIDQPEWLGEVHYHQPLAPCDADDALLPAPADPSRSELLRPILQEADLTFSAPIAIQQSVTKILDQRADLALPKLEVYGFPIANEPIDSFRPANVPPPTLVTFDDLKSPLGLFVRYRTFELDEQRRLEALLSPSAARLLNDLRGLQGETKVNDLRQLALTRSDGSTLSAAPAGCCGAASDSGAESTGKKTGLNEYEEFQVALRQAMKWEVRSHLLDSNPDDQHVVVEIDNEHRCRLRFGDGQLGKLPPGEMSFYAQYGRGNGEVGNIGGDAIKHLVYRHEQPGTILRVRNPRPARGGVEPETLDHARLHAPRQFHKPRRAITAEDYAQLVLDEFPNRVQQVRATLHWMGTWFEVAVAIDPFERESDPQKLIRTVESYLRPRRRLGHLLRVGLPQYVGLQLSLTVCVASGYLRAHVRQELLDRFTSGLRSDGKPGYFHPDNFTFGDSLYMSRIVQEARKVSGVENVVVTQFERFGHGDRGELEAGIIEFGPLEIPRLENDPLRPERGCFRLEMRGER